ncbi:MAG: hypothetical protein GKR86_03750 [Ilumatobacter sp.]|nr:hypothetical protein [Ilumatobacter sp.]
MTQEMETQPGPTTLLLAREWSAILVIGILTVALGAIILAWPSQTLAVLSVLLGIQLLVFGVFRLIGAFADNVVSPGFVGFIGILGMIAGVVVLRHPFETVTVLATILGAVWIVTGVIEIIDAIANKYVDGRGWLALAGLLSIAAGSVIVAWPEPTVTVVAWIAGFYLIVFGLFISASAFSIRSLTQA